MDLRLAQSPAPQASNVVAKEKRSSGTGSLHWCGAATRLPSHRVGDWGPFAGSESSKSRDRQRSALQEGPLVYPSIKAKKKSEVLYRGMWASGSSQKWGWSKAGNRVWSNSHY